MACERFALSIGAVVALLTACAGNGAVTIPTVLGAGAAFSHHQTFKHAGASQTFSVPSGVTAVKIVALGGNGTVVAGTLGGYGRRRHCHGERHRPMTGVNGTLYGTTYSGGVKNYCCGTVFSLRP